MKINIELNFVDNKTYLNYRDWYENKDITCEVINGELFLQGYNKKEQTQIVRPITFKDFENMVKDRIDKIERLENI